MKYKRNFIQGFALVSILFIASAVQAAGGPATGGASPQPGLGGVIVTIKSLLDDVVPICLVIALIYFIYGLAEYILESGETNKKEEGRTRMIYGTIAMFVIASVWGLVYFLQDVLGVSSTTVGVAPSVTMLDQSNLG